MVPSMTEINLPKKHIHPDPAHDSQASLPHSFRNPARLPPASTKASFTYFAHGLLENCKRGEFLFEGGGGGLNVGISESCPTERTSRSRSEEDDGGVLKGGRAGWRHQYYLLTGRWRKRARDKES